MLNHIKLAFFTMVLIACSSVEVPAQESDQYSQEFSDCITRAINGNASVGECVNEEYALQSALLKNSYTKLLKKLPPVEQKALVSIQKQWEAYRKSSCAFMSDFEEWGAMGQDGADMCYLETTAFRVIQLDNYSSRF